MVLAVSENTPAKGRRAGLYYLASRRTFKRTSTTSQTGQGGKNASLIVLVSWSFHLRRKSKSHAASEIPPHPLPDVDFTSELDRSVC